MYYMDGPKGKNVKKRQSFKDTHASERNDSDGESTAAELAKPGPTNLNKTKEKRVRDVAEQKEGADASEDESSKMPMTCQLGVLGLY